MAPDIVHIKSILILETFRKDPCTLEELIMLVISIKTKDFQAFL